MVQRTSVTSALDSKQPRTSEEPTLRSETTRFCSAGIPRHPLAGSWDRPLWLRAADGAAELIYPRSRQHVSGGHADNLSLLHIHKHGLPGPRGGQATDSTGTSVNSSFLRHSCFFLKSCFSENTSENLTVPGTQGHGVWLRRGSSLKTDS